jgi:hypothetical protein
MLSKIFKKVSKNQGLKFRNNMLYFSTTFFKKKKKYYTPNTSYKNQYKIAYKNRFKRFLKFKKNFIKMFNFKKNIEQGKNKFLSVNKNMATQLVNPLQMIEFKSYEALPPLNFLRGKSTNYFRYYMYTRKRFTFKYYRPNYRNIVVTFGKINYKKRYSYLKQSFYFFDKKQSKVVVKIKANYPKYKNTLVEKKANNLRNRLNFLKKYSPSTRRYGYMQYIKYYKAKYTYFNFRRYPRYFVRKRRYKPKKWACAKRYKLAKRRKIFKATYTLAKHRRRFRYRLKHFVKVHKYKYFSYYWLRYFFNRFKKVYLEQKENALDYPLIKQYLLTWLRRLNASKYLAKPFLNPARGFLVYKTKQRYSRYKRLPFLDYSHVAFFEDRNVVDVMLKDVINRNQYMYRTLYWRYYKSFLERKKLRLINQNYRYVWSFRPYIYIQKKYKMYYNWGDRHLFKRFPIYRYKYTLFFKFPRYADYRRLFKNQLREQHVFRYLYRLKLSQLIKHYRKATYKTKRIFELMFLKHFELRLDTVVHRLNFAWSLKHARQLILRGLFLVNNKVINSYRYHVNIGDVIMPIKRLRMQPLSKKYLNYIDYGNTMCWLRLFGRQIQMDQYPEHFLLNERIPAGMVITNVNPNKVRYNKPFSLQFLTLSLLKYS